MAISTYKVFLMNSAEKTGTYTKLVDIKEFPDLGGAPELLETTTTSDKSQTFINGIQTLEAFSFTGNYDKTDLQTLLPLVGVDRWYSVWFGGTEESDGTVTPTGENGQFTFKGQLSVFANGGGINEVVNMTITISPSTPIVITFPSNP